MKLKAKYDPEANAIYIHFTKSRVVRTMAYDVNQNIDYDSDGNVVGVEFIDLLPAPSAKVKCGWCGELFIPYGYTWTEHPMHGNCYSYAETAIHAWRLHDNPITKANEEREAEHRRQGHVFD